MEKGQKESCSLYRELFYNANDCIYTINLDGQFLAVNNSLVKAMKCDSARELLESNISKWMTTKSLEKARKFMQEVITEKDYYNKSVEIEIICKDGEHVWFEHKARPIKDKNNTIIGLHGIGRDITEKIRLEKELKESEAKYRKLFENANDGIYAHDTEGNFTSINKKVLEILGETEEKKVVGANFSRWLTPDSLKIAIEALRKAVSQEITNASLNLEIVRSNNEHRWIEINAWVIKDGNRVTGINGIARDVTERLELEEKLKASEALYKDLFENADDPMYTHDLKGNILSINNIGLKLLAATEEEIIGSNISKWVTPESYKIFEDRVRKIFLNQPLDKLVVMEVINKKGEHKWGEARTRLLKDGNKIIGTHGIMRDITEKKMLEKKLKVSEEKYRDLFENAQDGMYVLDNERNFLKMNHFGLQTLGCTEEEVIGTNISKWITPDSMKIVDDRHMKRLAGEIVDAADVLEIVCKNGEHRWIEIKTREIKDGDRTIEIHGIARDITQNRLLKQELKKSNKQQKLLCYLIQGTRGGKTRALILKHLAGGSFNANQLATALKMDYKTIRHHLNVLIKNGIIGKGNNGHLDLYFLSNNIEVILNDFNPAAIRNR
jgi:PAS domain S-box-containing protein